MSSERIFWKSALAAGIVARLTTVLLSLLLILVFSGSGLVEAILKPLMDRGSVGVTASLVFELHTLLFILSGGLFALAYSKIPLKGTLAKAFVFDTAFYLTFGVLDNVVFKGTQYEQLCSICSNNPALLAGTLLILAAGTFVFARVFDLFKNKEEAGPAVREKRAVLASIPRRLAAFVIDTLIIVAFALVVLIGLFAGAGNLIAGGKHAAGAFTLIVSIVFIMLAGGAAYWTITEGKYGGSLGKRALKMKVVKENGKPISYEEAFVRNATKFFPGLEMATLADYLSVLFTGRKQRLLDKVARTIVIRTDLKQGRGFESGKRLEKASFGSRFAAVLIDQLLLLFLLAVFLLAAGVTEAVVAAPIQENGSASAWIVFGVVIALGWAYEISLVALKSRTIGKQIMGVKVCNTQGKTPLGWKTSIIRRFSRIVSAAPLLAGYFWILVDKNKQGWHDKLAGTFVVKDRRETFSSVKALGAWMAAYAIAGVIAGTIAGLLP